MGTGVNEMPPGSQKGVQVVVADVEAARRQLIANGVNASDVDVQPWGSFVYFKRPRRQHLGAAAIAAATVARLPAAQLPASCTPAARAFPITGTSGQEAQNASSPGDMPVSGRSLRAAVRCSRGAICLGVDVVLAGASAGDPDVFRLGPLLPWVMSNSTFCPSSRPR
jgi:hypothetical protein